MQLYFVNCLVGFFVVVATFPTTSARVPYFFGRFAEEAENADSEALDKPLFNEPTNELSLDETMSPKNTNQEKNKPLKNYVKVLLGKPLGVEIKEGQSYTISCTVLAYPQATIHWFRGENLKEQIAEFLETSVAGDSQKVDPNRLAQAHSKYVIDCASEKDAGPIHCVGISRLGVDHQSTIIIVEPNNKSTPPTCNTMHKPVITSSVSTILSVLGSTVVIPCKAKGFPEPKTEWTDNEGHALVDNTHESHYTVLETGELIIDNLSWEDMGSYTCTAKSLNDNYTDEAKTFIYPLGLS